MDPRVETFVAFNDMSLICRSEGKLGAEICPPVLFKDVLSVIWEIEGSMGDKYPDPRSGCVSLCWLV